MARPRPGGWMCSHRWWIGVLLLLALLIDFSVQYKCFAVASSDDDDDDDNKGRSDDNNRSDGDDDDGKRSDGDKESSEWLGSDGIPGSHECNGYGERYCADAHDVEECPEGCNPWECAEESSDQGDKSDGIINSGKYDYVYWDKETQKVCVSYCWRRWDDMRCKRGWSDRVRYYTLGGKGLEAHYCKWIDCEEAGEKISGCHELRDFFQPTCENCRRLFPKACAPRIAPSASKAPTAGNAAEEELLPPVDLKQIIPSATAAPTTSSSLNPKDADMPSASSPPAAPPAMPGSDAPPTPTQTQTLPKPSPAPSVAAHPVGTTVSPGAIDPFLEELYVLHLDFLVAMPAQAGVNRASPKAFGNDTQWLNSVIASAAALPHKSIRNVVVVEEESTTQLLSTFNSFAVIFSVSADIVSETAGATVAALHHAARSGFLDDVFGAVDMFVVPSSMKIEMETLADEEADRAAKSAPPFSSDPPEVVQSVGIFTLDPRKEPPQPVIKPPAAAEQPVGISSSATPGDSVVLAAVVGCGAGVLLCAAGAMVCTLPWRRKDVANANVGQAMPGAIAPPSGLASKAIPAWPTSALPGGRQTTKEARGHGARDRNKSPMRSDDTSDDCLAASDLDFDHIGLGDSDSDSDGGGSRGKIAAQQLHQCLRQQLAG